jgi:hypothetical protein
MTNHHDLDTFEGDLEDAGLDRHDTDRDYVGAGADPDTGEPKSPWDGKTTLDSWDDVFNSKTPKMTLTERNTTEAPSNPIVESIQNGADALALARQHGFAGLDDLVQAIVFEGPDSPLLKHLDALRRARDVASQLERVRTEEEAQDAEDEQDYGDRLFDDMDATEFAAFSEAVRTLDFPSIKNAEHRKLARKLTGVTR